MQLERRLCSWARWTWPCSVAILLLLAGDALGAPEGPAAALSGEQELVVPPGGGAFAVAVHAGAVCVLAFPEPLARNALTSSSTLEIKAWGNDSVAVRGSAPGSAATLALATVSGKVRINVTIRVVSAAEPAVTLVRLRAADEVAARAALVAAELERQLAAERAALTRARAQLERAAAERADQLLLTRLLLPQQRRSVSAHERTTGHVVLHLDQAWRLGDAVYLFFELENRGEELYRVREVEVARGGVAIAATAAFGCCGQPGELGAVAAGRRTRGVVALRAGEHADARAVDVAIVASDGDRQLTVTGIALP